MQFENISNPSNMEKIESQKGKAIILVEGYRYRKDRANADGSTTWRCCKKDGCRGRMKMLNDVVLSSSEHNHAPDPAKNEAAKVVSAIRKRAVEGVEKPRQIIQQARAGISMEVAPHLPAYVASQRAIERQRKRNQLPYPNPQNVAEITIPEPLQTTTRGQNFVLWDSGPTDVYRMMMFGTMDNINRLQQNEHWFVDGTFRVAPVIFYQVFTIHALIDNKAVPLVYCLIQDKTEATYIRVFEKIVELLPTVNPASIMSDFEKATQNAIQHVFPNARLVGCLFHLGQCLWRKVQDLGLSQLYHDNEECRMTVKMLLALSFVPVNDVCTAFEHLVEASPAEIMPLVDYWEDTYIGRRRRNRRGDPRFALAIWNVHNRVAENLPRTNNSVEAWHRAFQQTVDCNHPSVYKLINQFRLEQDHIEIELERHLAGVNQPEASKNKYVQLNRRLQAIASTYANDSMMDYLRGIAHNLAI